MLWFFFGVGLSTAIYLNARHGMLYKSWNVLTGLIVVLCFVGFLADVARLRWWMISTAIDISLTVLVRAAVCCAPPRSATAAEHAGTRRGGKCSLNSPQHAHPSTQPGVVPLHADLARVDWHLSDQPTGRAFIHARASHGAAARDGAREWRVRRAARGRRSGDDVARLNRLSAVSDPIPSWVGAQRAWSGARCDRQCQEYVCMRVE